MRKTLGPAIVLVTSLAGCSAFSNTDNEWSADDLEYKLASEYTKDHVSLLDPTLDDWATALDELDSLCQQDRKQTASALRFNMTAVDAADPGHDQTALEVLQELPEYVSDEEAPADCTSAMSRMIQEKTGLSNADD